VRVRVVLPAVRDVEILIGVGVALIERRVVLSDIEADGDWVRDAAVC
jgi:hypothetical protein